MSVSNNSVYFNGKTNTECDDIVFSIDKQCFEIITEFLDTDVYDENEIDSLYTRAIQSIDTEENQSNFKPILFPDIKRDIMQHHSIPSFKVGIINYIAPFSSVVIHLLLLAILGKTLQANITSKTVHFKKLEQDNLSKIQLTSVHLVYSQAAPNINSVPKPVPKLQVIDEVINSSNSNKPESQMTNVRQENIVEYAEKELSASASPLSEPDLEMAIEQKRNQQGGKVDKVQPNSDFEFVEQQNMTRLQLATKSKQNGLQNQLNFSSSTSKYTDVYNRNRLNRLIQVQQAERNVAKGSLSEMDPQVTYLDKFKDTTPAIEQGHTYNHKLDPSRIVKQGDYCYREVNLATQINPHATGLGYKKFCGEDKIKQQLRDAIDKRTIK
ncbi:hypothetical protein [Shewanella maritima]|uniref:hypothetical protein n=1 Tax=Shewanella maritima TaxID=2520507 RepID=UPI00373586FF